MATGIDVEMQHRTVLSSGTRCTLPSPKKAFAAQTIALRPRDRIIVPKSSGSWREKSTGSAAVTRTMHQLTTAIVRNHGKWIAVEEVWIKNFTKSSKEMAEQPSKYVKQKIVLNDSILEQELEHLHNPTSVQG